VRVKGVHYKRFKRFTDLKIENLPETAKLVILAGPNGSGKSSFFEGLFSWYRVNWSQMGHGWDAAYYEKQLEEEGVPEGERQARAGNRQNWQQAVQVAFHGEEPQDPDERRKAVYVRSAYRNDPAFQVSSLSRMGSPLTEQRFNRFSDNDATVGINYQRLASQSFKAAFTDEDPNTTIGEFRKKAIGEIQEAMRRLFPDLVLNDFGDPLEDGTFFFDKGTAKSFSYQNLSGGEKASFDLILDLIVKRKTYDNTVYCIDEPEAHMNTRLQGALLEELFRLVPDNCQLWLATHSIGMMRRARDIANQRPGEVIFLDFGDKDFDQPTVLEPEVPSRAFWQRVLHVAFDDLAALVAPARIVICEGAPLGANNGPNTALDAACFDRIFEQEYPDVKFISAGSSNQVEADRLALMEAMKALVSGADIVRLIDRDDHSPEDIADRQRQGIRVLTLRNIECYLYDDEVLTALCKSVGKEDLTASLLAEKQQAIQKITDQGKPADDIKSASGLIYVAAKKLLSLNGVGNNAKAFMRSTLAPLITPDMAIYKQLKADIFAE
jgi:predicted ATPase